MLALLYMRVEVNKMRRFCECEVKCIAVENSFEVDSDVMKRRIEQRFVKSSLKMS